MKLFRLALLLTLLPAVHFVEAQSKWLNWPTGGSRVTVYVSPLGSDAWSGKLPAPNLGGTDGPFQHISRAQAYVEALDKSNVSVVAVQLRGGVYQLTTPLSFTSADNGSASTEIVYQNFPGETPIISGGMRVTGWTNAGGNKWQTTLPAGTAYFENLYYNGERRLRPRLGGYLGLYFRVFATAYVDAAEANCPFEDKTGDAHDGQYECFDRFDYDPDPNDPNSPDNDPITETWSNLATTAQNPCNQKAGNQALLGDIEILDFEQFNTSKLHVNCVDQAKHRIYLTGPTTISNGNASQVGFIQGNRYVVENVQNAQSAAGQWFLDRSAGLLKPWKLTYLSLDGENPNIDEVVVPQATQLLVASGLQYVAFLGLTFGYDNYTVPPLGHPSKELEPDISAALSFQNSSNITFYVNTVRDIAGVGLDFITCMPDPSGGTDPAAAPVAECVATAPSPTVTGNVVANSSLYEIGALGVRIGDPYSPTNLDSNVPNETTVENNVVEGYGRTIPASFGIGQGVGHKNTYDHNEVYDGYHCAISISQSVPDGILPPGVGNADNTISFNHVHNLLQGIMNDGGSIRIEAGNDKFTAQGNKIWNNKIHDTSDASAIDNITNDSQPGYGGDGIYMDNSTGAVDVENNLVYRVSGSAIYTPHGPNIPGNPNTINNNILAYARHGMIAVNNPYADSSAPVSPNDVSQVFVITSNIFYFDRTSMSSPAFYLNTDCTYTPFTFTPGDGYGPFQDFHSNLYWRTDGGFASDGFAFNVQFAAAMTGGDAPCAGSQSNDPGDYRFYDFTDWMKKIKEDKGSFVTNPNFANPAYPRDDYTLLGGLPNIGFQPFDANGAGRYGFLPWQQPPSVAPTFHTYPFNPATDF